MNNENNGCGIPLASVLIIILGLAYFIGGTIYVKVRDTRSERKAESKKSGYTFSSPSYDYVIPFEEVPEEEDAVSEPVAEKVIETPHEPIKPPIKKTVRAHYEQGYNDGYECGYDDADQNAGYGYSWYCDGKPEDYLDGFRKGYSLGYAEGREDYEAFNDEY